MGLRLEQVGRRGGFPFLVIGRIGECMPKDRRRQGRGIAAERVLQVRPDHPHIGLETVPLGILLAQHGVAGGVLDAGQVDRGSRARRQRAATPVPIPASNTESPAAQGTAAARKTESIPSRKTLFGLQDAQLAAEEAVLGERGGNCTGRRMA